VIAIGGIIMAALGAAFSLALQRRDALLSL
jgi:hypothetical protein